MNSSNVNSSKEWLCVHFPDLPIEIFLRGTTVHERDVPVVVLDRQRVAFLNDAASDLGVEAGNSMDTAYSLSEHVISFERNIDREIRMLFRLGQWAYQFTPSVSIREPDCLVMDITGCMKLFNGIEQLKLKISQGLKELGFNEQIGTATTPEASVIAAKHCPTGSFSLEDFPISCLETGRDIIDGLHQMGIRDIHQLFELPRSGITRRFGVYFVDYLERVTGERPDPRKFIDPKPDFFSEISFLYDVTNLDSLAFPIKRLLGELSAFLHYRQLAADHLAWKLSHRSHPPVSFSISLANPENDDNVFLSLTQLRLEKIDNIQEVDSISLAVKRFFPLESRDGNLFPFVTGQPDRHDSKARANHLLNMIHARLGTGACFGLSLANDHRPEKAWKHIRIGQKEQWQPVNDEDENPRPLFLLEVPKALNMIDGHPSLGGKLELLAGPERIDFGWWDERTISTVTARDYYVARRKTGSLLWVFKHLVDDPRWYLHGIFS